MNVVSKIRNTYNNARQYLLQEYKSIREDTPVKKDIRKKDNRNYIVKAISFMSNAGRSRSDRFYPCDYDLDIIRDAINTDSYLKVTVQKNMQLFFKAGYTLRSENDKASKYIEQRFRIMSYCTGQSCDVLWKEIANDLECFSNAFLIKTRVDSIPFTSATGMVESGKPVGGYFRVDPSTISVKYDDNGYIKQYKQKLINGKEKDFKKEDVVHFTYDREAGSIWGVPRIIAALEDVKLLRNIEGNVATIVYRHSMPVVQVKVGLPTTGMGGTKKEIDDAKYEIEHSPMDGVYVTNERTEFKAVGIQGAVMNATPYLKYFEDRVFSVLNMSQATMGRGGSKQDADSMEEQAHNKIKNDQALFAAQFEAAIINELLIEGGFNPILNGEDVVKFVFNEVNVDTKVKLENHEMTKFTANLITFDEARRNIGLKSDNVDEDRLYANMIDQANTLEQIKIQNNNAIKLAKLSQSQSNDDSDDSNSSGYTKKNTGNGKTVGNSDGGKKAVQAKNTPSNQHGTYSAKIKENKHAALIHDKYSKLTSLLLNSNAALTPVHINQYKNEFKNIITKSVNESAFKGSNDALKALNKNNIGDVCYKYDSEALNIYIDNTLNKLMNDIKEKADCDDRIAKESGINSIQYRAKFLCDFASGKAYWYSYAKTASQCGVKQIKVTTKDDSSHSEKNNYVIDTNSFKLDDIPTYSAGCTCSLSVCNNDGSAE